MKIALLLSRITHPASRTTLLSLFLIAHFNRAAFAQAADDKHATFFMGRVRYSANDGNDCSGVGQDLMKLVSRASTLKIQEERKVRLTDPDLYETPFLFMRPDVRPDSVISSSEPDNPKIHTIPLWSAFPQGHLSACLRREGLDRPSMLPRSLREKPKVDRAPCSRLRKRVP